MNKNKPQIVVNLIVDVSWVANVLFHQTHSQQYK